MKMLIVVALAAFACVGCNNKQESAPAKTDKPAETTKEATKPATTPAALAQAPDPDEDIPTTADFEEEAEKEITKDSVDAEVDKLAKEIGE